jgi:putative multiple sugar transport system permease protein
MSILGLGTDYQQLIKGLVLLLAVGFDIFNKNRAGGGSSIAKRFKLRTTPPATEQTTAPAQTQAPAAAKATAEPSAPVAAGSRDSGNA